MLTAVCASNLPLIDAPVARVMDVWVGNANRSVPGC
jgi:hypothetical protein